MRPARPHTSRRELPTDGVGQAGEDTMTCAEPDSGGTVVDGYCDVCGTAPATDSPSKVLTSTAPMASTPRSRGSGRTGSSRAVSARGRLGAGVVSIAPVPKGNPATAI